MKTTEMTKTTITTTTTTTTMTFDPATWSHPSSCLLNLTSHISTSVVGEEGGWQWGGAEDRRRRRRHRPTPLLLPMPPHFLPHRRRPVDTSRT